MVEAPTIHAAYAKEFDCFVWQTVPGKRGEISSIQSGEMAKSANMW